MISASDVGCALRTAHPEGGREATRRIYRRVIERTTDRKHEKILKTDTSP